MSKKKCCHSKPRCKNCPLRKKKSGQKSIAAMGDALNPFSYAPRESVVQLCFVRQ